VEFHIIPGPLPDTPERRINIATLIAGVSVDLFFGPSTLGAPAVTRVFEDYSVMFEVPAGITSLSARVHALVRDNGTPALAEVREYGMPLPTGANSLEGFFALQASSKLAQSLALDGGQADPTKALLGALARDCSDRDVSGAQFELIDADTGTLVPTSSDPGAPRAAYSQFALPSVMCTYTVAEAPAWMLVNAPVNIDGDSNTHAYRLRIKGRMRASDPKPVIFAEGDVELFPGVITRIDSLPRAYR
jgi:hypothetical protein